MQWQRITAPEDKQMTFIRQLYETSFPPEERREFAAVKALLADTRMHLMATFKTTGEATGFVIYWQFKNFLFIEHLAVDPSFRGEGWGAQIVQQVFSQAGSCCLLEVEHPHDEDSRRRIQFYQRLGFQLNELTYFQPPYSEGGQPVPMLLLSDRIISPVELEQFIEEVKQTVYNIT